VSDRRLRELEQRWQETQDPQVESRLLAERLRAGDLERRALELCAYLDHAPARAALGLDPGDLRLPRDLFRAGVRLPLDSQRLARSRRTSAVRLQVSTIDDDLSARLQVNGALDLESLETTELVLCELKAYGVRRLALDLSRTPFVGSFAISLLIRTQDRLQGAGGSLVLVEVHPSPGRVLDLLGMGDHFVRRESVADGLATLRERSPLPDPAPDPAQWLRGLQRWGAEAFARGARAAGDPDWTQAAEDTLARGASRVGGSAEVVDRGLVRAALVPWALGRTEG
jgi:anti-sigma B factor antagonist